MHHLQLRRMKQVSPVEPAVQPGMRHLQLRQMKQISPVVTAFIHFESTYLRDRWIGMKNRLRRVILATS
jgi:hypothetical protein